MAHAPWVEATPATVHPAGRLSPRTTPVASFGPLLVTTMPYAAWSPTTALGGLWVTMDRSAMAGDATVWPPASEPEADWNVASPP
jgi:hypothetical protein